MRQHGDILCEQAEGHRLLESEWLIDLKTRTEQADVQNLGLAPQRSILDCPLRVDRDDYSRVCSQVLGYAWGDSQHGGHATRCLALIGCVTRSRTIFPCNRPSSFRLIFLSVQAPYRWRSDRPTSLPGVLAEGPAESQRTERARRPGLLRLRLVWSRLADAPESPRGHSQDAGVSTEARSAENGANLENLTAKNSSDGVKLFSPRRPASAKATAVHRSICEGGSSCEGGRRGKTTLPRARRSHTLVGLRRSLASVLVERAPGAPPARRGIRFHTLAQRERDLESPDPKPAKPKKSPCLLRSCQRAFAAYDVEPNAWVLGLITIAFNRSAGRGRPTRVR